MNFFCCCFCMNRTLELDRSSHRHSYIENENNRWECLFSFIICTYFVYLFWENLTLHSYFFANISPLIRHFFLLEGVKCACFSGKYNRKIQSILEPPKPIIKMYLSHFFPCLLLKQTRILIQVNNVGEILFPKLY